MKNKFIRFFALHVAIFTLMVQAKEALPVFRPHHVDFGKHNAWETQYHTVQFVNPGPKPIQLTSIRSSCGCLRSEAQRDHLAAGETAQLILTLDAATRTGKYSLFLYVEWNIDGAAAPHLTRLPVTGEAVQLLSISPDRRLRLGKIESESTKKLRITLHCSLVPVTLGKPELPDAITTNFAGGNLNPEDEMPVELLLTPRQPGTFRHRVSFPILQPVDQPPVIITIEGIAE